MAGLLGGLLGIGGGIVLMPLLRFGMGMSPAYAAGTCVLAVFFTTLGGSYRHYRLGHLDPVSIYPVIISGALATVVFSILFPYLSKHERWMDLGIGLVFTLISARMIAGGVPGVMKGDKEEDKGNKLQATVWKKIIIGGAAGALPGLLGIGTGGILVPAFAFIMRAPIRAAVASSLACFCFNALISAGFKLVQGYIEPGAALPICLGTLLGANLGAVLNRLYSQGLVELLFGLVFAYVSLKFILVSFGVKI